MTLPHDKLHPHTQQNGLQARLRSKRFNFAKMTIAEDELLDFVYVRVAPNSNYYIM
jgi:hypothetical protein